MNISEGQLILGLYEIGYDKKERKTLGEALGLVWIFAYHVSPSERWILTVSQQGAKSDFSLINIIDDEMGIMHSPKIFETVEDIVKYLDKKGLPRDGRECIISNETFSWVLKADGKEVKFQGHDAALYLKQTFEKLKYKVTFRDNLDGIKE